MHENKFSIINFYERRARRILPALIFTIIFTSIVAPFILLPDQIKDLGQTIVSISTFLANYFFYLEIDYFNEFSSKNPLLHTWSLAVEEQFYFVFPIILLAIPQKSFKKLFLIIITMLCISFYAANNLSSTNMSLSFYSIHTRAWELLFGSIAALLLIFQKNTIQSLIKFHKQFVSLLILLSFISLAASFYFFNEKIHHPGPLTLIPVFSTFLLILFLDKQSLFGRLLSNSFVVKVGLISYSLYLIHNPIFSYIDIYFESSNESILTIYKTATLPLIFLLSYISYVFIEKPFRNKSTFNRKKIFTMSALSLSVLFSLGLYAHLKNGFTDEIANLDKRNGIISYVDVAYEKEKLSEIYKRFPNNTNNYSCIDNDCNDIFVIGDSMANDTFLSLANSPIKAKVSLLSFDDSCMSQTYRLSKYGVLKCGEGTIDAAELNFMLRNADQIIISALWVEQTYTSLPNLIEYIREKSEAKINIMGSILFSNIQTLHKKDKNSLQNLKEKNFYNYVRWDRLNTSNKLKGLIKNNKDIYWIEKSDFFCNLNEKKCSLFDDENKPLIWDNGHLTTRAFQPFSEFILDRIN